MNTEFARPGLADALARFRFAYLLTTGADGHPHAVAVTAALDRDVLVIDSVGRRSRDNLLARPATALVWPPESPDGQSLIIDGEAGASDHSVWISPIRAVLHRSTPRPRPAADDACGSDCIELSLPTGTDNE